MTPEASPTPAFRLRTLGDLDLRHPDGRTLRRVLVQPKRVALLAYLANHNPGRAQPRDPLLALFWPESTEKDARAALRQSIYFLRKCLGKDVLTSDGESLRLNTERLRCDTVEFEHAFADGDLDVAMDLYGGEFLSGLHLDGVAPELEFWLENRRVDLRDHAVEAARGLAERALEDGEGFRSAEWARRALALDADDEDSLQLLITILDAIGDRTGAVRTYEEFERRIVEEYELEPSAETTALIESIRTRPQRSFDAAVDAPAVDVREEAADPGDGKVETSLEGRTFRPWPLPGLHRRVAAVAAMGLIVATVAFLGPDLMSLLEAEDLPPTIAVLPFEIQGDEGADVWREGAVDLLSTQLDGALGLRAIDARTVLARWRERLPPGHHADLDEVLALGRALEARYLVAGTAVSGEDGVRLKADLYDVQSGRRVGTSVATGGAEQPFELMDRVAVDVIKALFQARGEGAGPARLADITTRSVPALRAYLDGEILFRRSAFEAAIGAYRRAVAADSTFALAWYRLSLAHGFTSGLLAETGEDPIEVAMRYVDRLPEREAMLLRANRAFQDGTLESIELAHRAVQRYPEDPEAWYLLGETYYHLGPPALIGAEESDRAFAKAIALDSLYTPAYIHMIHRAFNHHADSARAARLIEAFARYEAGTVQDERNRIAFDLVFGDTVRRDRAGAVLDTLSPGDLRHIALNYLWHPDHVDLQEEVLETRRPMLPEWDGTLATLFLYFNAIQRGDLERLLELQDDPHLPARYRPAGAYLAREAGLRVPGARMDSLMSIPSRAESVDATETFFQGAYAAEQGRWTDHATSVKRIRGLAKIAALEGDSTSVDFLNGAAMGLEGYEVWRRGNPSQAVRRLEVAQRLAVGRSPRRWVVNSALRLWLGRINMERNQPKRAVRYYASLQGDDLLSVAGTRLLARALEGTSERNLAEAPTEPFAGSR